MIFTAMDQNLHAPCSLLPKPFHALAKHRVARNADIFQKVLWVAEHPHKFPPCTDAPNPDRREQQYRPESELPIVLQWDYFVSTVHSHGGSPSASTRNRHSFYACFYEKIGESRGVRQTIIKRFMCD
jgi:hypothetical protein